jgi:long-subunit fatty acid transport protein
LTKGNSDLSEFHIDPFLNFDDDDTNDVFYENVESQEFLNITGGSNDRVSFTLAGQYDKNTSFGISVITHSLDFFQNVIFLEENTDDNDNTLNARLDQRLTTFGDGIGFNFGVISKLTSDLRLGLAYQTPIWYDLTEEFQEDTIINLSNTNNVYTESSDVSVFDYRITTPSKLTGSIAYIFGKNGLISVDYIYSNYDNIKLKPSAEFDIENQSIKDNLKGASQLRIGGEYRLKNISLRAGYHFEENPVENTNLDDENGYSLGIGFKFTNSTKLDLSYSNTNSNENYSFLNTANPANLDITNEKIIATLTIGL